MRAVGGWEEESEGVGWVEVGWAGVEVGRAGVEVGRAGVSLVLDARVGSIASSAVWECLNYLCILVCEYYCKKP